MASNLHPGKSLTLAILSLVLAASGSTHADTALAVMHWQELFAFSAHYGETVTEANRQYDFAGEGETIDADDLLQSLSLVNTPDATPTPSPSVLPVSTPTQSPTWDTGPNYTCTPDDTWTPFPAPSITATFTPRPDVGVDPVFVYVPSGLFIMGSTQTFPTPAGADESPVHTVRLDAFYIGKYEVTQQQFQPFIDAGGYTQDAYW